MAEKTETPRSLLDDLRWFATTLHEPQDARSLYRCAAEEIETLRALHAPVTCLECKRVVARSGDWYRCFDCGADLCRECTEKHFGHTYSKHHEKAEEREQLIRMLGTRLEQVKGRCAELQKRVEELQDRITFSHLSLD